MDQRLPSFDEKYRPQIEDTLNTAVDHIQATMIEAQPLSADAAEKLLDDACNDCIKTFQNRIEDIRTAVRNVRPDPRSPTYDQDNRRYADYVQAAANGVEKSKNLFDTVFERIRNIVSTVIECIKAGVKLAWDQLTKAFTFVRSLWTS